MLYRDMTATERQGLLAELYNEYEQIKSKNLTLDMSRGKPCGEQLQLSSPILSDGAFKSESGADCRNYGELTGIIEMRRIFAEMLSVPANNVVVGGNSSLNLMYDMVSRAYTHGLVGSHKPWGKYERIKFLCPSPGYDRHFAVTEFFGAELVLVPMLETGPDMDIVERLVKDDENIKGIWCVPVYSNPTGCVFSDETVKRLAAMQCAAADFTIVWDNAYCVHDLFRESVNIPEIMSECELAGNPNRAYEFASTSKITFSGAGVSCVASSKDNIEHLKKAMFFETIGYDKLSQLTHARFLKDMGTIREHMEKHADIIRPKFLKIDAVLKESLDGLGIASWVLPKGGYFINYVTMNGAAKLVVSLCADAGVKLTPAGAAFPYGNDPDDANIRLAPTFPTVDEIETAGELIALCTKIASLEILGA